MLHASAPVTFSCSSLSWLTPVNFEKSIYYPSIEVTRVDFDLEVCDFWYNLEYIVYSDNYLYAFAF